MTLGRGLVIRKRPAAESTRIYFKRSLIVVIYTFHSTWVSIHAICTSNIIWGMIHSDNL